ncbi:MAG: glycoside hydrolase family 9 protein [Planctomycetota bacterium]|nr:glycoside hydrolase family 9 protein [Planctomycetota bacterium]
MRLPHWVCCLALACALVRCAEDAPRLSHIDTVAPDVLGITIETGRVIYGKQEPYVKQEGDTTERWGKVGNGWLKRGGKQVGGLVGKDAAILRRFDALDGQPLDTAWADAPASYSISSPDDPAYKAPAQPVAVCRKSKPSDMAQVGGWEFKFPMTHRIYLKLSAPLAPGKSYALAFQGGRLPEAKYVHQPDSNRSEAVHVSHVGFRPDDPAKVAFLSCWLGSGGPLSYTEGTAFSVLDDKTGKAVFDGTTALSKAAARKDEDPYKRNYNGTDVYLMDFSTLKAPGTYRVSVTGIGCSYPFEIGPDVWRKAFLVSAKSLYYQRSGIELGPPCADFKRPRCFHPDDGVKVCASTCSLMDSGNGLNAKGTDKSNFENLVKGKTDEIVPNAWGGYFDAGDWDRRIQHLDATRLLLELAELYPDFAASAKLNIPESGNGLPDVLNEALWNLNFFRRLQTPEGGIRGGIESAAHPQFGEASWQESLTVMTYAPDPWCSFLYAADAARASGLLEPLKPDLAKTFRESALKALAWGEAEYAKIKDQKLPHAVRDARNLAAASLFSLTGDAKSHAIFLETTAFKDPQNDLFVWQKHEQRDAAFVYARSKQAGVDKAVQENARKAIVREADASVALGANTGFKWTKLAAYTPFGWGTATTPAATTLLRAHFLSADEKYLRAAVLACQSGAGANPVNICYTTGLGHGSPRHPLLVDQRVMGWPPSPGITSTVTVFPEVSWKV